MNYVKIFFSPTGGTERIVNALIPAGCSVNTIDLSKADTDFGKIQINAEDAVIIGMPSFGGLAPQIAITRLGLVHGNGAKCAIVAVYGNRAYEDTLVQMEDAAKKSGLQVIAAVSAVAEHSIMHQYATGRPNDADKKQLSDFAMKINEKFQSGDLRKPVIPGNRPYKKAGSTGLVPKANNSCVACGLCAKRCPVQAINPQELKKTDGKKCISCMRCVAACPQHARSVNGFMVSVAAMTIKKACSVPKQNELFL